LGGEEWEPGKVREDKEKEKEKEKGLTRWRSELNWTRHGPTEDDTSAYVS
jgi:hypothetical protein